MGQESQVEPCLEMAGCIGGGRRREGKTRQQEREREEVGRKGKTAKESVREGRRRRSRGERLTGVKDKRK